MCRRAAGMTRCLMLLTVVLFPTDLQACEENDGAGEGDNECQHRSTDFEIGGPTNLSCYLAPDHHIAVCTWKDAASPTRATYRLYYSESDNPSHTDSFSAGSSMRCSIEKEHIFVKTFITVWVESCMSGCCYSSDNITLRLNESVRYEAPTNLSVSKLNGTLTMTWERRKHHFFLKRARYREDGGVRWTEVDCMSQDINELETCRIRFEKNFPFEIQVKHKRADIKNLWSEWSKSVKIPAEIVVGPELNYTVGNPSQSGHRKLDLHWKEAEREKGDVEYTISVKMVACPCEENIWELRGTSLSVNISETSYNVSIFARNRAGSSPMNFYIIESHQETGPPFRDISLSGTDTVQVLWWEPKKKSSSYCVEWHPVSEENIQHLCSIKKFEVKNFTHKGRVDPTTCYRIAVYQYHTPPSTWNMNEEGKKIWKTLGSTYYYKPSQNDVPRNVSVTGIREHSAIVIWDNVLIGECHGVLQKYNITIYPSQSKDSSKGEVAMISRTVHNFSNLSAGIEYTVEIKGETEFGEETGIAQISFRTLKPDEAAAAWKLPVICIGILLGVFTTGGLCFIAVKRFKKILCPEVPTPVGSVAVKFSQDEMRQVCDHKELLYPTRSSAGETVVGPLIVVPNRISEVSFGDRHLVDSEGSYTAASKEGEMGKGENLVNTGLVSESLAEPEDLLSRYKTQQVVQGSRPISLCETDPDADDLPFSYQRQMVLASGEEFQEGDEELVDLISVRAEANIDEQTILHLLDIKGLFIAGSDNFKPENKLNEQKNLSEFEQVEPAV